MTRRIMMKKKLITNLSLIYTVILTVYVLAVLIIPFDKTASSWIAFGFTVAAFPISFGVAAWAFNGDASAKGFLYGLPIFKLCIIYLAVNVAVSIIFYILGAFVDVPVWITILLFVIALSGATVGVVMTSSAKETVEAVESDTKAATKTLTYFNVDVASLINRAKNKEVNTLLSKLSEDFKYSDPVSSEATAEKEAEIKAQIDALAQILKSEDNEAAKNKIDEISVLLADRNRICKAFK